MNTIVSDSIPTGGKTIAFRDLLSLSIFLFGIAAFTINGSLQYLLAFVAAILFGIWFVKDVRVRFASTLAMIIILQVEPPETGITLLGYIAIAVFFGGLCLEIIKKKVIQQVPFTTSPLLMSFSFFLLVWNVVIGAIGISAGSYDILMWAREFSLWIPLFLLPVYYSDMAGENRERAEKFLTRSLILLWLAVFILEVVKIRTNLIQSAYLFEIGVARYDTMNGAFMMFIFLTLAMSDPKKPLWQMIVGLLISAVSVLLTFGRTAWIASLLFLPVVLFLGNTSERKRGYRFLFSTLLVLGSLLLVGYIFVPMVRIGVSYITSIVFSARKLKTDPSMYNRYVEWEHILRYIFISPLSGYGFGAYFHNYDWLKGIGVEAKYTHNGYLSVLFKSGIVGFVLLFIPYIGFFVKGIGYLKNDLLTAKEKGYLRAGIVTILFATVIAYTGNVFYQREMMMYIAFYWGYCIQIEQKIKTNGTYQSRYS